MNYVWLLIDVSRKLSSNIDDTNKEAVISDKILTNIPMTANLIIMPILDIRPLSQFCEASLIQTRLSGSFALSSPGTGPHHSQVLTHPVFLLLPISEAKMCCYSSCKSMEQITHHINRGPNVSVIAAGIGSGVLLI